MVNIEPIFGSVITVFTTNNFTELQSLNQLVKQYQYKQARLKNLKLTTKFMCNIRQIHVCRRHYMLGNWRN